jgi:glycerate dehydrogenase
VVAHDAIEANPPDYEGFRWMPADALLAESDVVSLHCPLSAENKGMIHRDRLARMKKSALLLNTSRGPLVVDEDLATALNNGVIAGAGLDVLSMEPPADSNPLLSAKNCVVTPHIAWATREARGRLLNTAVTNVRCFIEKQPQNVV